MAEILMRFVEQGKLYDELPARIRKDLSLGEYKLKLKEHCIRRGSGWSDSVASSCCGEQEYHEDLLRFYKREFRIFPYHLSEYLCRHMRMTPFRYYSDLLFASLKEEKPYHQLPNFTATDMVRILGVGRNEYIDILNACRAKKLLWRVNKGIAKEHMPVEPCDVALQPWWRVHVVNLGVVEFKQLSAAELALLETAAKTGGAAVEHVSAAVLQSVYKRGLVYIEVPVFDDDKFAIPPLEGFVSNKDTDAGQSDPMEALLYSVFVANSERMTVAQVAAILDKDVRAVRRAMSVAARLGFAQRLQPGSQGLGNVQSSPKKAAVNDDASFSAQHTAAAAGVDAASVEAAESHAAASADDAAVTSSVVAVIVDTETTGYLMMGALSPGLKKHSVTLFEGGRVAGDAVMDELVAELWASVQAGAGFEGEMKRLTDYAAALATLLECVKHSRPNCTFELLRRESLAGLTASAARRVLAHAYLAVVPIILPPPALPLSPAQHGPTNFGATAEAATAWLPMLLMITARCGPLSFVLPCGQQLRTLPRQLEGCTCALLTSWNPARLAASASPVLLPNLVHATWLLHEINAAAQHAAVLVQPLFASVAQHDRGTHCELADTSVISVPLPLADTDDPTLLEGHNEGTKTQNSVRVPPQLRHAIQQLGLSQSLGYIRMLPWSACRLPFAAAPRVFPSMPAPSTWQPPTADAALQSQPSSSHTGTNNGGKTATTSQPQHAGASNQPPAANATDGDSNAIDRDELLDFEDACGRVRQRVALHDDDVWVPFEVRLGVPVQDMGLCQMVCSRARRAAFLSGDGLAKQKQGQQTLQQKLIDLISRNSFGNLSQQTKFSTLNKLQSTNSANPSQAASPATSSSSSPSNPQNSDATAAATASPSAATTVDHGTDREALPRRASQSTDSQRGTTASANAQSGEHNAAANAAQPPVAAAATNTGNTSSTDAASSKGATTQEDAATVQQPSRPMWFDTTELHHDGRPFLSHCLQSCLPLF